MTEYRVTWTIDIDADSPRDAAEFAHRIQTDPDSIALLFEVAEEPDDLYPTGVLIDLASPPQPDTPADIDPDAEQAHADRWPEGWYPMGEEGAPADVSEGR
jgi:hypothetical protein